VVSFTPLPLYPPGKGPAVPIGQDAGWAPELAWTTQRREHSLSYLNKFAVLSGSPIMSCKLCTVAEWLRLGATSRKAAGSRPDDVNSFI
jgi:hypothetical protein